MNDIPEDVMKRAEKLLRNIEHEAEADHDYYLVWVRPMAVDAIARALMEERAAERERCAALAESDADWTCFRRSPKRDWKTGQQTNIYAAPDVPDDTMPTDANVFAYRIGIAAGAQIAAAIRGQPCLLP